MLGNNQEKADITGLAKAFVLSALFIDKPRSKIPGFFHVRRRNFLFYDEISVNKVNRVLDGINLISGREGTHVSPGIYINDKMMALGMTKAEILAVFYPETDVAKMGEIRRTYRAVKNQTQGAKKK